MRTFIFLLSLVSLLNFSCDSTPPDSIANYLSDSPNITGKSNYLNSPYVTAGNRVYMVGHQNGGFPDLGWHIKGEMGGIWNHPIKLMDGFDVSINMANRNISLDKANRFVNYPMANMHSYDLDEFGLQIERWQFVPDDVQGLMIQFVIRNNNEESKILDFEFNGHSDLRPTWLGERTDMVDSEDNATYNADEDAWQIKDQNNPWSVMFGSDMKSVSQSPKRNEQTGVGASGAISYSLEIAPQKSKLLNVFIAGSYISQDDMKSTFDSLKSNWTTLIKDKKERYAQLAKQSKLTIPDSSMQQAFEWLKYNCDWLIREVPEVGTGITAGIPDYPWWFGVDSEYALKGYMAIGQERAVYETIKLLDSVSAAVNGNGRIIHEMSSNGAVFNEGNINETPQFASLIWEIFKWNGDKSFLVKYYPTIKSGLQWLMETNDDNQNLFPDGFGMMEIHGLDSEMIDVASYTQRAFDDAAKMALILGETSDAKKFNALALELKNKINSEFWSEDFNSYADFIGTDEQTLHLIDDAIVRADTLNKPWAIEELNQTRQTIQNNPSDKPRPFVLHHNWVVNTPLEMQIADREKAIRALNTAEKFVNPFGVFVTGIDRDESAGSDDGSFQGSKVFSYTGAVMTLPTGVQVVAENNYGRPDKALNYLERMTRTFNYALPGSIYEVSPDYGMMCQAWNIYSYAVPIVQQFFGINPMTSEKQVTIRPRMPEKWDHGSLENVKIGDNMISVFYKKEDGKRSFRIEQKMDDWTIQFDLPGTEYDILQGAAVKKSSGNSFMCEGSGKILEFREK
ncbi:MAG: glycogen debranching protein [Bacteroidia bacterium]|nr:glycogen debranching protein [Bacteroidia bacterium]